MGNAELNYLFLLSIPFCIIVFIFTFKIRSTKTKVFLCHAELNFFVFQKSKKKLYCYFCLTKRGSVCFLITRRDHAHGVTGAWVSVVVFTITWYGLLLAPRSLGEQSGCESTTREWRKDYGATIKGGLWSPVRPAASHPHTL